MLVEIKGYMQNKSSKPKIRFVICEDPSSGGNIILVSDNVKYFNGDGDYYSIQMNDIRYIMMPSELKGMVIYMSDDMINSYEVPDYNPNNIDFDGQFKVILIDDTSRSSGIMSISSISILPTNNDLNFNIKNVTEPDKIKVDYYLQPDESPLDNEKDEDDVKVVEEDHDIYNKLVVIEEKLDYIINKIGG